MAPVKVTQRIVYNSDEPISYEERQKDPALRNVCRMIWFITYKVVDSTRKNRLPLMLLWLAMLCVVSLSSCVLQTHQRVLDTAKEYEGIVELDNAVYQLGNRYFVKCVQTTLRRSQRNVMGGPFPEALGSDPEWTGVYTPVPNAPRKILYREFRLRDGVKPFEPEMYTYPSGCSGNTLPGDDADVWSPGSFYEQNGWHPYYNKKGQVTAWYLYPLEYQRNREYKDTWLESLPKGAHPVLLTAEQIAVHPVLLGKKGAGYYLVSERSEARVDSSRALYAYPLAAVCWLVPDALATAVINLPLVPVLLYSEIEDCCR